MPPVASDQRKIGSQQGALVGLVSPLTTIAAPHGGGLPRARTTHRTNITYPTKQPTATGVSGGAGCTVEAMPHVGDRLPAKSSTTVRQGASITRACMYVSFSIYTIISAAVNWNPVPLRRRPRKLYTASSKATL